MQEYVITGGAGFIGSHICERLVEQGAKVFCIDNLITGAEENISKLQDNKNFVFINHDVITGPPQVSGDITGIFHLASPASPSAKSARSYLAHPLETLLVNSLGTKNMLDLAVSRSCPIVYSSSSEVYGDPTVTPQSEDYFGNVSSIGIRSVYDEGKRFGESMCMTYFRNFDADVRIIRIFNTYGDRMQKDDGRVVSNFINQALENQPITVYGDGQQTRSFCYIDDMVEGLVAAISASSARGEVINLGNPDELKIIDLASKMKEITGSKSEIVHEARPEGDPSKRKPDISKAKRILNFEPKVSLDDGLSKTIEYFKKLT